MTITAEAKKLIIAVVSAIAGTSMAFIGVLAAKNYWFKNPGQIIGSFFDTVEKSKEGLPILKTQLKAIEEEANKKPHEGNDLNDTQKEENAKIEHAKKRAEELKKIIEDIENMIKKSGDAQNK